MNNIEWIKLVDFGNYQHVKGLQVVDRNSGEDMVKYFHSLRGKFMRRFSGLPIYIGHPDDPDCQDLGDKKVYGRIENLKIENDALWILSRWTSIGKKIFSNKFLRYLSPRWMMKKLSDKVFSPVRLLSVGLTNHPNVRCDHTVNIVENNDNEELAQLVDNKHDSDDFHCEELSPTNCEDVTEKIDIGSENECNLDPEITSKETNSVAEVQDVEDFSKIIVDNKNVLSEPHWHTCSLTGGLIERRPEVNIKDKILRLVYEHMHRTRDDYQTSWAAVKRQNPGLFQ